MGEIKYKDNKYYFIPNIKEDMKEITGEELFSWLIYKGKKFPLTKNKYKIKEGDILKLGRMWIIIRAIHVKKKKSESKKTSCLISFHSQVNQSLNINNDFKEDKEFNYLINDDENSNTSEDENEDMKIYKFENKEEGNNIYNNKKQKNTKKFNKIKVINIKKKQSVKEVKVKTCRICYLTESDSYTNPLIKPCKCAGSMKYIHLQCLLHWLKTKIQIEKLEYIDNNFFTIYSPEQVECELCKSIFPHYIYHKKKLYNLMELEQDYDIDQKNKNNNINYSEGDNKDKKNNMVENNDDTDNNYVVIDTISFDKDNPSIRYIAKFNKDKILKIGRGLDMNLILNDLSISRNHCQLELCDNNDIVLNDNNSKFGTLILVQAKEIEILKGQTLTIQVGRTFFNINYKKNFKFFSCCEAEEIDKKKSYEKINYKAIKIENHCVILNESLTEGSDKDEKENKENEYENVIKNINNKKINIVKIRTKNKLEKEDTKINNEDNNNNENKEKESKKDNED